MKYTQKQEEAIFTSLDKILVAAAAGSGKTSVMAKRIVRLIKEGCSIENMLVMTFTKAATLQMKQKIAKELYSEAKETHNKALYTESELIGGSDICTIHSFCANVVRQNYDICGLLPNFKIIDETKADIIKGQVLRDMFDSMYEEENPDFLRLLNRFTNRSNDGVLAKHILKIYSYIIGKPGTFNWIEEVKPKDIKEYIKQIKRDYENKLIQDLETALNIFENVYKRVELLSEKMEAQEAQTVNDIEGMLNTAINQGFSAFREKYQNYTFKSLQLKNCASQEEIKEIRDLREQGKKLINAILKNTYIEDFENTVKEELRVTMADADSITNIVKKFAEQYREAKAEQNLLDYEDLQQYALLSLQQNPMPYAKKYTHIFLDEYQDTNPVQEEIIKQINIDNNLFMVGDIKQSIYKFRLADPTIFRQKAADLDKKNLINMNENFRSKKEIIKCVNNIMKNVMSAKVGEIEYTQDEALIHSFEGGEAKLILCPKTGEDKHITQAKAIAKSIKELIGTIIEERGEQRLLNYEDIAIIVRSRSDNVQAIKAVFRGEEIPCSIDDAEEQIALELFVNFLRIIDNPCNDIALLSVMRSIFFNYDEEDFAKIRAFCNNREVDFYFAAKKYAEEKTDDLAVNLKEFFGELEGLREYKNANITKDTVLEVMRKFNFKTYISSLHSCPKDTFNNLINTIIDLSESNDLYTLLTMLNDIKKREGRYSKKEKGNTTGVKVLTIHGAKGLEFSVVYIVDLDKKFNESDLSVDFLIDGQYGILPKYVDDVQYIKRQTAIREVVREKQSLELKSEELRVLYVAMTRAMEKLILVGSIPSQDMQKWENMKPQDANSLLDFILCAQAMNYEIYTDENPIITKEEEGVSYLNALENVEANREFITLPPYKKVPAKLSVTAIKKEQNKFFTPVYKENTDGEISGARLGTLIHSIMEADGEDAVAKAEEMLTNMLISKEEFDAVVKNSKLIENFYKTPLYERVKKAKKVIREQGFYLKLKAEEIGYNNYNDDEVLIQGIIDLAFLEDSWVIVDYKTDKVTSRTVDITAKSYKPQLDLYAKALSAITGQEVKECHLYFMRLDESILLV